MFITKIIRRVLSLIPKKVRGRLLLLSLGIFVSSVFEIMGLAGVFSFFALVLEEDFLDKYTLFSSIYALFPFQSENGFIIFLAVVALGIVYSKNIYAVWIQKKQAELSFSLYKYFAIKSYESSYSKGLNYFKDSSSHKNTNTINTIPAQFSQQLIINLFTILNEMLVLVFILIALVLIDPIIILVLGVAIVPAYSFFLYRNRQALEENADKLNKTNPIINGTIYETIHGYLDVAVSGTFEIFRNRLLNSLNNAKKLRVSLVVLQNIPPKLIESSVITAGVLIIGYGLLFNDSKSDTLAILSVFGIAAFRATPSIGRLAASYVNVKNHEFTLNSILNLKNVALTKSGSEVIVFQSEIKFEDVSFSYDASKKSKIIFPTFAITKGQCIGFIGRSGSGKTTLLHLLLGFQTPIEGTILIDTTALTKENIVSWRKKCGYVRQDIYLIEGSILDNILFGIDADLVDKERLNEIIKLSQLSDFIDSLSNKERTFIGENGALLSGGQRQRIGIARALYHGAEVLLFDEATSSLDDRTEREINESIKHLNDQGITIIIVAHKKSALKHCDHILDLSAKNED